MFSTIDHYNLNFKLCLHLEHCLKQVQLSVNYYVHNTQVPFIRGCSRVSSSVTER